ncbi:hypothetical protein V1286_006475 [Bradyrhizobium algeriense]|uniref:Uncharacterized protein n=1 Tax=Bradyrhizobium algeriense TaxID=634784 RepID=A0ABU8BK61_9BRAD
MNISGRDAKVFGYRVEFVGGVGQLRERVRKPRAIDAGTLPEIRVGAGRKAARGGPGGTVAVARLHSGIENRIAKARHRLGALLTSRCKHPQRFQARGRRQHRYRLALQQPGRIAIAVEFIRNRGRRLFGHQQMERQRRQCARRHDQKRGLFLDQRIDRRKQRSIQFMGECEVEQPGLAGCIARLADVQPAAERGNLLRQGIRAERDRTPLDTLARHRENIAFLLGNSSAASAVNDASSPRNAYPAFWGPFALIGEGAAR